MIIFRSFSVKMAGFFSENRYAKSSQLQRHTGIYEMGLINGMKCGCLIFSRDRHVKKSWVFKIGWLCSKGDLELIFSKWRSFFPIMDEVVFIYLLFHCPTANWEQLSKGQPHPLRHSVFRVCMSWTCFSKRFFATIFFC